MYTYHTKTSYSTKILEAKQQLKLNRTATIENNPAFI